MLSQSQNDVTPILPFWHYNKKGFIQKIEKVS